MKRLLIALFLITSQHVYAQSAANETQLAPGYYIIATAYHPDQDRLAQSHSATLNKQGYHSIIGRDPVRPFIYVYLDYFTEFSTSIQSMLAYRQKNGLTEAWVRVIKGHSLPVAKKDAQVIGIAEPTPKLQEKKPINSTSDQPMLVIIEATNPDQGIAVKDATSTKDNISKSARVATTTIQEKWGNDPNYHPEILQQSPVFLRMFDPANNKNVEGTVRIIDGERAKLLIKIKGNDTVRLPDPKSKSGKLTIIGESFGYRKDEKEINYRSTSADKLESFIGMEENRYQIEIQMIRLRKGDISTLFNVYFFNDAAVMLSESKYELNQLLEMMQSNPGYRIKLHGHTNGRATGKLISMGKSRNFFELTPDVVKTLGTAKDLSQHRAEVIRDWLIASGISADRMEIKAWGGNRMIHDKNSGAARKNVRVEVEVLAE